VSGSFDQSIKIWNLTDKTAKLNITTTSCQVKSLTILSNNEIVCGCSEGQILIYLSDGDLKQTLNAFISVNALVSYPINDVIVSESNDKMVRIWTNL
jgi:WD40 repeat protein